MYLVNLHFYIKQSFDFEIHLPSITLVQIKLFNTFTQM